MGKICYNNLDLLNLPFAFLRGKNEKERNGIKRFPRIKTESFVDGHRVGRIYKHKNVPTCFSCKTCKGAVAHPFDEKKGSYDVWKKIPLPH